VISLAVAQCETHARRMREMRNAFAHDYPEDSEPQAAILNRAFSAADRPVEILQHVKGFAARYAHE